MTEKELRHLKRAELLEILFYLQKENETMKAELEKLKQGSTENAFSFTPEMLEQLKTTIRETIQEINGEKP